MGHTLENLQSWENQLGNPHQWLLQLSQNTMSTVRHIAALVHDRTFLPETKSFFFLTLNEKLAEVGARSGE